jgi:tetratricopeptide (TPR) repeat protein
LLKGFTMLNRISALLLCALALLVGLATTAFAQTPAPPNEAALVALAQKQLDQKQYDLAVESSTQAITLNPNDAMAYSIRGSAYEKQDKYDQAIADCSTASSWIPPVPPPSNRAARLMRSKANLIWP